MLEYIRNLYCPERFHFHHRLRRGGGYFEGWYFKLVDAHGAQPYAIIPGVYLGTDGHAFIQVLDGRAGTACYHRFPLEAFQASRRDFEIDIAGNHFSSERIDLAIEVDQTSARQRVRGSLRFSPWHPWPVTLSSPGVMGPYSFVPFMECNHGILSLDHAVSGVLAVDGSETNYDGGRGYSEKDWGRAFPSGYVWTQSNHFEREGVSITASVARIPWLTGAFRGFLVGLLLDGQLHRFTTYTGAEIESLTIDDSHLHLRLRDRIYRLEIDARKEKGGVLYAPYGHRMIERVAETMTSEVELRFSSLGTNTTLYEGRGRHACLEVQGELPTILDD
jgi:hypothetical protein